MCFGHGLVRLGHGLLLSQDRFISKMFLRGDSVILVLRNPKPLSPAIQSCPSQQGCFC